MAALREGEEARAARVAELERAYGALEAEYAGLLRASAERERELAALRQSCDVTRSRMARQMAQVSEMVGASKYTIQTNAQKVQQLESHVRDLVRANRSVLTHFVLPFALKWALAAMSFLLFCVSQLVRGAKALFARRDQASRTLLAAETYVQSALLWMQSLQQRQEQQLGDGPTPPPLTPTSPEAADALLPAPPLPQQQEVTTTASSQRQDKEEGEEGKEEEDGTVVQKEEDEKGEDKDEEDKKGEACLLHRTRDASDE